MRIFQLFRKEDPVILSDKWLGKFKGNILESVAEFFPPPYSEYILNEPSLNARWKVLKRITPDGNHGKRFYTDEAVCEQIHTLCSKIYQPHHISEGYPNNFDGKADGLPLICIGENYFVIWHPDKLQI